MNEQKFILTPDNQIIRLSSIDAVQDSQGPYLTVYSNGHAINVNFEDKKDKALWLSKLERLLMPEQSGPVVNCPAHTIPQVKHIVNHGTADPAVLPLQWPRICDLPAHEQIPFEKWLTGQTRPMLENISPTDDFGQDGYYDHDYRRWKAGLPCVD